MRARRLRRLGQLTASAVPAVIPAAESVEQPTPDVNKGIATTISAPTAVPQLDSQKNKLFVGSTELSHDDDRISEMDEIHHKQKHQKFSSDHEQQLLCSEMANNNVKIVGKY